GRADPTPGHRRVRGPRRQAPGYCRRGHAPPTVRSREQHVTRSAESVRAVIKAYDVRGVVGDQIDEDLVREIGASFARRMRSAPSERMSRAKDAPIMRSEGAEREVIGHDMRESSPALSRAFAEGVTARGLDVVGIGLA